jgi:hypothetical protein
MKQNVFNIIYSCLYFCLSLPARKAHLFYPTLYFHLWPLWLCHVCPHYLINDMIFGKKVLNLKSLFGLSIQICRKYLFFWEKFGHVLSKVDIGLHVKYQLFLSAFNETWIFSSYFRKILSSVKFHKILAGNISSSIRAKGQTWWSL